MKLRDHRFLKFEAMMAVAAFVSSFIICSIIRYGLRMEVYLIVGLVGGHLLGGVLTWKVFVKEEHFFSNDYPYRYLLQAVLLVYSKR